MRGATGLLAPVTAVALLLTGCGGTPAANQPAPSQTQSQSQSQAQGQPQAQSQAQSPQSSAPAQSKEVTLMLNWIPYGEHAPFYYGVEKGFFSAEGIDLTIQPGGGSGKTIQAVAAKQVQIGWADTPALINGIAQGMPVKSVGVFLQRGPASVEFFAENNITQPSDLKGKSIAMTAGDAVSQTFPAFLAANSMTMDDIQVVNVDAAGKLAALSEGKVDAIIGFFHDQAPTIENNTKKQVNVLKYADYGVNVLSNGLIVHNDTLKNDPELVKGFLRAAIKSWEEAAKEQAAAADIMSQKAEKAPPKEVLAKQLDLTLGLLHTDATQGKRPGINAEADWTATLDLMAKYAGLQNAGKPSDYWDGSFAPN